MSATWTLKCTSGALNGTERTLAAWGLSDSKIARVLHGCDQATFRQVVADATVNLPFAFGDTATLYRTDSGSGAKVPWFSGVWTKPKVKLSPSDESFSWVLSGPWWYLGRLAAQVPWQALSEEEGVTPTAQTLPQLTMGQAPDGTQLNLGAATILLLEYVIAACQAQAVPFTPFLVGDIAPAVIVPYQGLLNMTCEQVLMEYLKWIPDSQPYFDYSTVDTHGAPTFHVGLRGGLAPASVPALYAPNNGNDITPRYDLQVPGVVIKYQTENTVDGTPYLNIQEDVAPAGASEGVLGTLVVTVDLKGGTTTYVKQPVTVHDAPINGTDEVAQTWTQNKMQWLFGPTSTYDKTNIKVLDVTTIYDPNDPGTMRPPGGNVDSLTEELTAGAITEWMNTEQNIYAALALKTVTLIYAGTDKLTMALFSDANSPGVMLRRWRLVLTNGATQTYTQLASQSQPELPPIGLAAFLFAGLGQLHYEGSVNLTEDDCSGLVAMGNTLNLSGSRAEWTDMAAQVTRITEDIDKGITSVQFGPPPRLGIEQLMDMYRVTRVRQPPYNANTQQTGDTTGTEVKGHTYAAGTTEVALPSMGINAAQWGLSFRKKIDGTWEFEINPASFIGTDPSTAGQVYCSGVGVWTATTSADTIVFIVGTVTSLVTTGIIAYVGHGTSSFDPAAAAWTTHAFVENDGESPPNQTYWRVKIADIDWSSGSPVALPAVKAALIITNKAQGSAALPAILPL